MKYLGIGKTKFNSSVCLLNQEGEATLWLTERLNRKKASGEWPHLALCQLKKEWPEVNWSQEVSLADNRDVHSAQFYEDFLNSQYPFYDWLTKKGLEDFCAHFNAGLLSVGHHTAHAYAALALSPFMESLIVVIDGAGSEISPGANRYEECSVFWQKNGTIKLIEQRAVEFKSSLKWPSQVFSSGMGLCYEKMSEFIFNSPTHSGKVMGLAPFGKAQPIAERLHFLENLDWNNAFTSQSKKEWELSAHRMLYQDLAASVQSDLETEYALILSDLKKRFPEIKNLILTGGCALNCTNNAKIYQSGLFEKIYVPPFPGDESIGFGLAHYLRLCSSPQQWKPIAWSEQKAFMGPSSSVLSEDQIAKKLSLAHLSFIFHPDPVEAAAQCINRGEVIAWFQGRSECGPRALGHRSILARVDVAGMKDYLNAHIKFREAFRPYGSSVIQEKASLYFEVDPDFENPFMSYAIKVKPQWQSQLQEVLHIDKTSRFQTIHQSQDERFYRLIKRVGELTGLFCVLNTSLNVMGEPIVETVDEAIAFFNKTPVATMFIGNFQLLRQK